jgi:hypothetical protein
MDRIPEYYQTLSKQFNIAKEKCGDDLEKSTRCKAQYDRKLARLQRIDESFKKGSRVCLKPADEAFLTKIKLGKPLSGYMLFAKQSRDNIQKENPQSGFGEIGRMIGIAWKALGDEGHAMWKANAATQIVL